MSNLANQVEKLEEEDKKAIEFVKGHPANAISWIIQRNLRSKAIYSENDNWVFITLPRGTRKPHKTLTKLRTRFKYAVFSHSASQSLIKVSKETKNKGDKSKELTLKFIETPSHGYLEVPTKTLRELGVIRLISDFSPTIDGITYLEEDCDITIFLEAAKKAGITIKTITVRIDTSFPLSV